MGLGENFRDGYLKQGQPLGMLEKRVHLTADNTIIDVDGYSRLALSSDNTTAANRTFTLKASTLIGHLLYVDFVSAASTTAQLLDTGIQKLKADWEPVQYDCILLFSDGTNWLEVTRGPTPLTAGVVGTTEIAALAVTEAKLAAQAVGLNASRVCIGLFDPSANAGERTVGAHDISVDLPAKAIITRLSYEVLTTFTSATDAGTIALSVEAADDLKAAVAISNGANPWDAGIKAGIPVATAATYVKTTVARKIVATVAVEALTAGKMYVYADYVQGF
jgi:hypothetical protein